MEDDAVRGGPLGKNSFLSEEFVAGLCTFFALCVVSTLCSYSVEVVVGVGVVWVLARWGKPKRQKTVGYERSFAVGLGCISSTLIVHSAPIVCGTLVQK